MAKTEAQLSPSHTVYQLQVPHKFGSMWMSCSCPHEHPTDNVNDQGLVAICNKQYDLLSNQLVSHLSNVFVLRRADTEILSKFIQPFL